MNTTTTAHIETLTAQVRTLQIGNRQVTLSVYRQLDQVPYDEMEPFGRVRDGQDRPGTVYAVGRHAESGSLVRSSVKYPHWAEDPPRDYVHWRYHTDGVGPYGNHDNKAVRIREATEVGRALIWTPRGTIHDGACSAPQWNDRDPSLVVTPDEYLAMRSRGDFCPLDQLARSWQDDADSDVEMLTEAEKEYRSAAALPLIVLAGMR